MSDAYNTVDSSSFSDASAGAMADLATDTPADGTLGGDAPIPAAQEALAADPVEPEATPAEQQAAALRELKVSGRVLQLTPEEYDAYASKGADYTQKTMALAEHQRQLEAHAQAVYAREAQINQWLQAQQSQQQAPQPDDVPNVQQVRQEIAAHVQQAKMDMQKELARVQFEAETARLTNEHAASINTHINSLLKQHPILNDLEDVSETLKIRVARQLAEDPTDDVNVVKSLLAKAAKSQADKLDARAKDYAKMESVRSAKLAKSGIEPPGGASLPAPAKNAFKLGSRELTAQVLADLNSGQ